MPGKPKDPHWRTVKVGDKTVQVAVVKKAAAKKPVGGSVENIRTTMKQRKKGK